MIEIRNFNVYVVFKIQAFRGQTGYITDLIGCKPFLCCLRMQKVKIKSVNE